jgi:hypothetical protein
MVCPEEAKFFALRKLVVQVLQIDESSDVLEVSKEGARNNI